MTETTNRLAVLIDADNAQASVLDEVLAEIAKLGVASVKRIYGDFTSTRLSAWKSKMLDKSIQPTQVFPYTTGKNASDIALIIDAMDLLHTKDLDGFCLISSDSDFTRLASRIREEGLVVYGFGQQKTPKSFVAACDRFIYTEILGAPTRPVPAIDKAAAEKPKRGGRGRAKTKPAETVQPAAPTGPVGPVVQAGPPVAVLRAAVESAADETGWAHLGRVGSLLGNRLPEFDPRNYGHRNLASLMEAVDGLDLQRRGPEGGQQTVYVRLAGEGG